MQRSRAASGPDMAEEPAIAKLRSQSSQSEISGPRARDSQNLLREGPLDITRVFLDAARALPDGKVHVTRDLDLFDTVGALEIGDAKMDSGLLQPPESRKPSFDVHQSLSLSELIHCMDIHFNYLMEWHTGMPLAQTLLSSNYVDVFLNHHRLPYKEIPLLKQINVEQAVQNGTMEANDDANTLVPEILKYYCIATIKSCALAIEQIRISSAPFYEDEDISLQTLGRDLFPQVDATSLDLAASEISRYLKDMYETKNDLIDGSESKTAHLLEAERLKAVQDRLLLIFGFVAIADRRQALRDRLQSAEIMLNTLDRMESDKDLSTTVPDVFDPEIQHRIASTSPLRPLSKLDLPKAYKTARNIIIGMLGIPSSMEHSKSEPNMYLMKRNLRRLACRNTALPFVKAVVFDGLWTESDEYFEPLLLQDIKGLLPLEFLARYHYEPTSPASVALSTFCHHALYKSGGYLDYFRAISSNPSRMRRVLGHVIEGFEELELKEAKQADEEISSCVQSLFKSPITTWVRLTKLELMQHVIEIGVEMGVYHDDDLVFIYGYLLTIYDSRDQIIKDLRAVMKPVSSFGNSQSMSVYDQDSIENLENLSAAMKADRVMLQSTYAMHQLARYLDPRPENYSSVQQSRRWDIRMRQFWRVGGPAVPSWNHIRQQCTLLRPEGVPEDMFVNEMFQKINRKFKKAETSYQQALNMFIYNEFARRLEQDELYAVKSQLAKDAQYFVDQAHTCWQNGHTDMKFDLHKHLHTTEDGMSLIYHIPGLRGKDSG